MGLSEGPCATKQLKSAADRLLYECNHPSPGPHKSSKQKRGSFGQVLGEQKATLLQHGASGQNSTLPYKDEGKLQ